MKTWSRLSSVICGRNECRLKRVTSGDPLPRAYLSSGSPKGQPRGVTTARLKGLIMKVGHNGIGIERPEAIAFPTKSAGSTIAYD